MTQPRTISKIQLCKLLMVGIVTPIVLLGSFITLVIVGIGLGVALGICCIIMLPVVLVDTIFRTNATHVTAICAANVVTAVFVYYNNHQVADWLAVGAWVCMVTTLLIDRYNGCVLVCMEDTNA